MRSLAALPLVFIAASASADPLGDLTTRVVEDLRAGRPLVVQVHVPLCDNDVLACGNERLGDGDRPEKNLYWATSEGVLGWLGRRAGGWEQVMDADGSAIGEPQVLDLRVWRRELPTPVAWQRAGAPKRYPLYLVTQAWRGERIARAFERYADDLHGATHQTLRLPDGTVLATGGDAQIVAWVGHNHLMDVAGFDWAGARARGDQRARGSIAIACHTAVYLQDVVPGAPLLLTRDYLYANAAALEGTVLAFATGGDYAAIRRGAAATYAAGGGKQLSRVQGAFSNPADRRWGTPAGSSGVRLHAASQRR
jgi:hypothetical protein